VALAIGVDVGGTKILAGVVDEQGRVLQRAMGDTPHRSLEPSVVEDAVAHAVAELRERYDVAAVGVGAAGFVDLGGTVLFSPHLSWRREPLTAALERRIGLPVAVDNDANVTALAEFHAGAGRAYRHAVVITLGTGIGGAVVNDGRLFRGAHGLAGEFGHVQVVPDGRGCECGQTGCWEQYCSGRALLRAVRRRPEAPVEPTGSEVTAAAELGDAWALAAFEEVGSWLGVGSAGLVAALDPEIIIIGGGLSAAGDLLLGPARTAFELRLSGRGFRPVPPLVRAELGPEAGMIGAGLLAHQHVTAAAPQGSWT
jgi:glucokinase